MAQFQDDGEQRSLFDEENEQNVPDRSEERIENDEELLKENVSVFEV